MFDLGADDDGSPTSKQLVISICSSFGAFLPNHIDSLFITSDYVTFPAPSQYTVMLLDVQTFSFALHHLHILLAIVTFF